MNQPKFNLVAKLFLASRFVYPDEWNGIKLDEAKLNVLNHEMKVIVVKRGISDDNGNYSPFQFDWTFLDNLKIEGQEESHNPLLTMTQYRDGNPYICNQLVEGMGNLNRQNFLEVNSLEGKRAYVFDISDDEMGDDKEIFGDIVPNLIKEARRREFSSLESHPSDIYLGEDNQKVFVEFNQGSKYQPLVDTLNQTGNFTCCVTGSDLSYTASHSDDGRLVISFPLDYLCLLPEKLKVVNRLATR